MAYLDVPGWMFMLTAARKKRIIVSIRSEWLSGFIAEAAIECEAE